MRTWIVAFGVSLAFLTFSDNISAQPATHPSSSRASEAWGFLGEDVGSPWQLMNGQVVTYRWAVPQQSLLEIDEATGGISRWTLLPDGTLERVNPDGGRAVNVLNADGSMTQYGSSRTQRQTVRLLGPVRMYEFELLQDGQWTRFTPYDWFAWRMTNEQYQIARDTFRTSTNLREDARRLLARFRGSSAVAQAEARSRAHQEALARQQPALPAATIPSATASTPPAAASTRPAPTSAPASEGRRVALVVGVSNYGPLGNLPNPVNDARAMAARLRQVGFDVELLTDPDLRQLRASVQRLGTRLIEGGRAGAGLFFFAGHGMQLRGENFLVPAGAAISRQADLELEAMPATAVLRQLEEAQVTTNVIILDACRNMPMARSWRSGSAGLAQVDAPNGSFIAYSTAPGSVAADGAGSHSPFAAALIEELGRPGQPIEVVFRNVRRSVLQATEGEQTPWDSSSLIDPFYFVQ